MLEINKKIIFYLSFAKSKLDKNCKEHQKAKGEIDDLIKYLQDEPRINWEKIKKLEDKRWKF